jgi:hypothetical protein
MASARTGRMKPNSIALAPIQQISTVETGNMVVGIPARSPPSYPAMHH